jgi:hypothetical protein
VEDQNFEHLHNLISQLDDSVPREGAVVVEYDLDDCMSDGFLANRLGYLRLGIEFLKAAFAEPRRNTLPHSDEQRDFVDVELDYLTNRKSNYLFARDEDVEYEDWFEPQVTVWPNDEEKEKLARAWQWVKILLIGVGLVTVIRWIWNF